MNARAKAAIDAIDKCIEEARVRKESDRMKKEYLLNGGMRVIKFGEVTEVTNKEKFDLRKLNEHLFKR